MASICFACINDIDTSKGECFYSHIYRIGSDTRKGYDICEKCHQEQKIPAPDIHYCQSCGIQIGGSVYRTLQIGGRSVIDYFCSIDCMKRETNTEVTFRNECTTCKKKLPRCCPCRYAFYCSKDCQVEHWASKKLNC